MCENSLVIVLYLAGITLHCCTQTMQDNDVWQQRPGDLSVCEGGSANFTWIYNPDTVEKVEGVFLEMTKPSPKRLFENEIIKGKQPVVYFDRVSASNGSLSSFILQNVTEIDTGTYNILIYHNGYKLLEDLSNLKVYGKTACPDPESFNTPVVIYEKDTSGYEELLQTDYIDITDEENITLHIHIPAAFPPVKCEITACFITNWHLGETDDVFVYDMVILRTQIISIDIRIEFKFIALPTSSRVIYVHKNHTGNLDPVMFTESIVPTTSLPESDTPATTSDMVTRRQEASSNNSDNVTSIIASVSVTLGVIVVLGIVVLLLLKKVNTPVRNNLHERNLPQKTLPKRNCEDKETSLILVCPTCKNPLNVSEDDTGITMDIEISSKTSPSSLGNKTATDTVLVPKTADETKPGTEGSKAKLDVLPKEVEDNNSNDSEIKGTTEESKRLLQQPSSNQNA